MRGSLHRSAIQERRSGAGFSLIEVLIVVAIILIIAAIAIPELIRSKMVANETAALSALRSITTVNVSYSSTFQKGFAPTLAALGPDPGGGPPTALHADLIDSLLASGVRNGYLFTYTAVDTAGNGEFTQFSVTANPADKFTGTRYFFVDETNVLRFEIGKPAGPTSIPVPK